MVGSPSVQAPAKAPEAPPVVVSPGVPQRREIEKTVMGTVANCHPHCLQNSNPSCSCVKLSPLGAALPHQALPHSVQAVAVQGRINSDLSKNETLNCRFQFALESQCWPVWMLVSAVTMIWAHSVWGRLLSTGRGHWFCHAFVIPSLPCSHAIS